jgi:hypothetical protein
MVPGGSDRNEFRELDPVIGELDRTPVGRAARAVQPAMIGG